MKINWLSILMVIPFSPLTAQDFPRKDFNPERWVDEIFPVQTLDLNYDELYENVLQRLSHPVDLNTVSAEELRSLFVLREEQVESLLAYRSENGPFLSVYELQVIPGFDVRTLYRLIPFVVVHELDTQLDASIVGRIARESNTYFITRYERTLETKLGYRSDTDSIHRYTGSPDKLYCRFRSSRHGDFSFGFTAEKDAGESMEWNPAQRRYGMDYYSFHAQVLNKGRLGNMILGDYLAQFGQGLVLGGGFGMGKGSEAVTTLRRSNLGFMPYSSVNESGFFRGGAITVRISKQFTFHGMGSLLRRDALLHADSVPDESSLISSFAISGYHRTPGERGTRKQIRETNLGAVLQYRTPSLDAGLIIVETDFSIPLLRPATLYNQFYFNGNQNCNASAFLNFSKNNVAFFSEAAQTFHHGAAITAGLLASLTPQWDVSLLYRNFSRTFYSFYSNALAENSSPQNESGFYWGLKFNCNKQCSLSGYLDLFRFPWLRYRGYAPSEGSEWLLRLNYQPSKKVSIFLQAREESKIRNLPGETTLYQAGLGHKSNFWINCDYAPALPWSLKTRVQFSTYRLNGQTSRGIALVQDVNFDVGRFSISGRYTLFDTGSYDNRLYQYERDVALAFSFPAYDGVGVRRYALIQYKLSRKVDLWLRWAKTRFTDRETMGSSGEAIAGNRKNDVKLQLRIKL